MSYSLKGKLHKIFPVESKTETFQTREFVVETQETYPQFVKFQLTQDKCGLVDSMQEGMEVEVQFDLRGREWNGKYFTNLQAWRIERAGDAGETPADSPAKDIDVDVDFDNDLPF